MIDPFIVEGWGVALYARWLEVGAEKSHASSTKVEKEEKLIFMLD